MILQKLYVVKSLSMGKTTWISDKIFYQSERKIEKKIFFAWNVLKRKVKARNSRNSTFFLKKLKFSPLILKNTLKIFMSQGLDKACLVQRFLAQALNLCSHLLVSSLLLIAWPPGAPKCWSHTHVVGKSIKGPPTRWLQTPPAVGKSLGTHQSYMLFVYTGGGQKPDACP